jgi:hypothetical protein
MELIFWDEETHGFKTIFHFTSEKNPEAKRLRIIYAGSACHNDFIRLTLASQPFTLMTGDQSLSEGLALGKAVCYDHPAHKRDMLTHLDSICRNRIKRPEAASLFQWDNGSRDQYLITPEDRAKVYAGSRELSRWIHSNYNLNENIGKKVEAWYIQVKVQGLPAAKMHQNFITI